MRNNLLYRFAKPGYLRVQTIIRLAMKTVFTSPAYPLFIFLFICWMALPVSAQQLYPNDAYINVEKVYGIKGDGVMDISDTLQKVIIKHMGRDVFLYFPAGTYIISKSIRWRSTIGTWSHGPSIRGAGQNYTKFVLKANSPDFQDKLAPRPMFEPGSSIHDATGGGADAFKQSYVDFSIEIQAGNPGAYGIDYLCSNFGHIKNLHIKDMGDAFAGLAFLRLRPGPALIKNVEIEGFDYGIYTKQAEFGYIFEYITLKNQRKAGIYNEGFPMMFRKLTSVNSVPVLFQIGSKASTLIDGGSFSGGKADTSALVILRGTDETKNVSFYFRDITSNGYQTAVSYFQRKIPGNYIDEFAPTRLDGNRADVSFKLPVEETPEPPSIDTTQWVNVLDFDPGVHDQTTAIEKALASGKPVVYFPQQVYMVSRTLSIPAHVRRLVFGWSILAVRTEQHFDTTQAEAQPLFRIAEGAASSPPLFFEEIHIGENPDKAFNETKCFLFDHVSSRTLVLSGLTGGFPAGKRGQYAYAYRNHPTTGKLFLEDVSMSGFRLNHSQKIWARQFNPEPYGEIPGLQLNNVKLWVLGMKTEGHATVLSAQNSEIEILGGFQLKNVPGPERPYFILRDSKFKFTFAARDDEGQNFPLTLKETWRGKTHELWRFQQVNGFHVPLYITTAPREGTGTGLVAHFYDRPNLLDYRDTRAITRLDFDSWPSSELINADGVAASYSREYIGFIQGPYTGEVEFRLVASVNATLYVDDVKVVEGNRRTTWNSGLLGKCLMQAGKLHKIRIVHNKTDDWYRYALRLFWRYNTKSTFNGGQWQTVPTNYLYPNHVRSITLVNADNGQPIPGFDPIVEDAILDLATLPTTNITIRANTEGQPGSVQFSLNNTTNFHTDNTKDFFIREIGPDAWNPDKGDYMLTTTPYLLADAQGIKGNEITVNFKIINSNDKEPPKPPVLTATTGTEGCIMLNWTASTDNIAIAGYDIYVDRVQLASVDADAVSYELTGLAPEQNYQVQIKARDTGNNERASNEVAVAAGGKSVDRQAPTIPQVTAIAGEAGGEISILWTVSTDNVAVTAYEIYLNGQLTTTVDATVTTYTLTDLTPGEAYQVVVRARDAAGNIASSNPKTANAADSIFIIDTTPPTAPVLTASTGTNQDLLLSWTPATDDAGVYAYEIYVDAQLIVTVSGQINGYTVAGISPDQEHQIYVQAVDATGNYTVSNTVRIRIAGTTWDEPRPRIAFSPNEDGVDDTWQIDNRDKYLIIAVQVYNRDGKEVFHSSNYHDEWNGNWRGQPLTTDAYYYVLTYDKRKVIKGAVTLVR